MGQHSDNMSFMDIYWYGQAFFKLKGKNVDVLIDPFDPNFTGLKLPKDLNCDVAIKTHEHGDHANLKVLEGNPVKIEGPGEYEVKGVNISGISTFHDKKQGEERGKNTVYNIELDNLNIVHLGDLGHVLLQEQIQKIGSCDILLIPVGGVYTIGAKDAVEVVSQLEPNIVIPMHYKIPELKFELNEVEDFLKEMGVENVTPFNKLSITKEKLPEEPQVMVLAKS